MILKFETEAAVSSSTETSAVFQNENHRTYFSVRDDSTCNNAIMRNVQAGNVVTTKNHHSMNIQNEKEFFKDKGSLFSRLKCRTTPSGNNSQNEYDSSANLSVLIRSKGGSKSVHKISTPWLNAGKDRNSATGSSKSDRKKSLNYERDCIKTASLTRQNYAATGVIATKRENENIIRSALCRRSREAPDVDNILSVPKPIMLPTRNEESSSNHLYRAFSDGASDGFNSIEIQKSANGYIKDVDDNDTLVKSKGPSKLIFTHCGEIQRKKQSIETKNHNDWSSPFSDGSNCIIKTQNDGEPKIMMESLAIPIQNPVPSRSDKRSRNKTPNITFSLSKQIDTFTESLKDQSQKYKTYKGNDEHMKFLEAKITTPRRGNSRLPSTASSSRVLKKPGYTNSIDLHGGRFEPSRELLMGIEMHRDLSRILLKCGTDGYEVREDPSYSDNTRKISSEIGMRFSILPSSMSCFNSTSQLDEFNIMQNNQHSTSTDDENKQRSSPARFKSPNKNICVGTSSALLLDIEDDDPFWKHYEDILPSHRSLYRKKAGIDFEAIDESRDPKNSMKIVDQRVPCDGDDLLMNRNSEGLLIYENKRYHTRYEKVRDPIKSQTLQPFEPEQEDVKYLMNGEIPKLRTRFFSTYRESTLHNGRARNLSLERECISTHEKDKNSRIWYEYLMNYPTQIRSNKEESPLNKKALLNHMREAVQKASAKRDSHKIEKAMDSCPEGQYRVMTMETECSDENSYVSNF